MERYENALFAILTSPMTATCERLSLRPFERRRRGWKVIIDQSERDSASVRQALDV